MQDSFSEILKFIGKNLVGHSPVRADQEKASAALNVSWAGTPGTYIKIFIEEAKRPTAHQLFVISVSEKRLCIRLTQTLFMTLVLLHYPLRSKQSKACLWSVLS